MTHAIQCLTQDQLASLLFASPFLELAMAWAVGLTFLALAGDE